MCCSYCLNTHLVQSLNWLKEKSAGNPCFHLQNYGFPVDFPLNQFCDSGLFGCHHIDVRSILYQHDVACRCACCSMQACGMRSEPLSLGIPLDKRIRSFREHESHTTNILNGGGQAVWIASWHRIYNHQLVDLLLVVQRWVIHQPFMVRQITTILSYHMSKRTVRSFQTYSISWLVFL